jgi:hypothetical protein
MKMNKSVIATALAITLCGAASAAYAWGGEYGHDTPAAHQSGEHRPGSAGAAQKVAAYSEHGGGHEQANNNATVHAAERGAVSQQGTPQAVSFEAHGGGHEQAPNNAAIHSSETKNPNHAD